MIDLTRSKLLRVFVVIWFIQICTAAKVSTVDCSNGKNECNSIGNAICDVPHSKCKCDAGYEEGKTDTSKCVKILGVTCTDSIACAGVANSNCKNLQCVCADTFGEMNNVCTKYRVSETDCADRGSECSVYTHAECDVPNLKCKCGSGYKEDSIDGSTCVSSPINQNNNPLVTKPRVSAVVCSNGGNECKSIGNAICDVPSSNCKCGPGYVEGQTDSSKCVKILGGVCTGNSACTGDANSMCKNKVCVCADTFGEKNNVCTKNLNSTTCTAGTECNALPNAECDTATKKCKCSAGFKMNVNTCEAENAGVAITTTFAVFALPIVLAMKEAVKTLM